MLSFLQVFRRICVVVVVVAIAAAATSATKASAHSPAGSGERTSLTTQHGAPVPPQPAARPPQLARSASIGWLLARLLGRAVHRGASVVATAARRWAWGHVQAWTRQQVVYWWCSQWHRYFGYDVRRWYWAAQFDWRPRWAWNFCASNGF